MFVGVLKHNLQRSLFLGIFCLLLGWVVSWFFVDVAITAPHNDTHPLYTLLFSNIHSNIGIQAVNLLLIGGGTFLLNYVSISQELSAKTNFLSFFIYLLIALSSIPSEGVVHPVLVANIIIILSLNRFFTTYRKEHASSYIYEAAFYLGLSALVFTPFFILFPLCFIAISILRSLTGKDVLTLLLGYFTPLFIYMCVCYLVDADMFGVINSFTEAIGSFKKPVVSEYYYLFNGALIILLLFAIISIVTHGLGSKVKTQKEKTIIVWLLFLMFIGVFITHNTLDSFMIVASIPLSVVLADYLSDIKQLKIANTLLTLLIGSLVIIYLHKLSVI